MAGGVTKNGDTHQGGFSLPTRSSADHIVQIPSPALVWTRQIQDRPHTHDLVRETWQKKFAQHTPTIYNEAMAEEYACA